jgi:hypothetical protein
VVRIIDLADRTLALILLLILILLVWPVLSLLARLGGCDIVYVQKPPSRDEDAVKVSWEALYRRCAAEFQLLRSPSETAARAAARAAAVTAALAWAILQTLQERLCRVYERSRFDYKRMDCTPNRFIGHFRPKAIDDDDLKLTKGNFGFFLFVRRWSVTVADIPKGIRYGKALSLEPEGYAYG